MKLFSKLFIFTLVSVLSFNFTANAADPEPAPNFTKGIKELAKITKENTTQIENLLKFAYRFKGVPYRLGANGPHRFDCSGFTSYVFREFGYKLARRASLQVHNGKRVERGNLKAGDLVFFGGRSNRGGIGHVGIITEVDANGHDFYFIHASTHNGITVNHSTNSYYKVRYRGACRVIQPKEPELSLLDELKKSK
ncbi:MAG: C40 family peptidase [Muribaculaceae bacterium]|nr:C40 family peptidase [Muribaculaceae bacterium]